MFRESLGQLITKDGSFSVCGEADNIESAMEIIQTQRPNIIITDITLRGSSGLELIKGLNACGLDVPVIVLSMHAEAVYAERVVRAGAKGYISKQEASSTLLKAVHHVLDGNIYLSKDVTGAVLAKASAQSPASRGLESLTDRELEVFQLMGKGLKTHEIAEQLHLGDTTVDTYRARIKEKLHLRNASDLYSRAAQWVHEQGL